MSESYAVDFECSNCDATGRTSLPKGHVVPNNFHCPNCGCNTARKQHKKEPQVKPASRPWVYDDRTWQVPVPQYLPPDGDIYPRIWCGPGDPPTKGGAMGY